MSTLEPRIEAIRQKYNLSQDDFWQIKQNKQWVCKHAALEIVATKAGIEWMPPQIIEARAEGLVTSLIVTGKLEGRIEWATGETNPTNYSVTGKQPAYPWAMSEKRAKDRVILKLSGVHGLLYSDAEVDQNASQSPTDEATGPREPLNDSTAKLIFPALQSELRGCSTQAQLNGAWERWNPVVYQWSDSMIVNAEDVWREMTEYLKEHAGDARSANREVIEADLRASVSEADLNKKWSGWGAAMKKLAPTDVAKLQAVAREVKAAANKPASAATPDFTNLAVNDIDHKIKVAQTP